MILKQKDVLEQNVREMQEQTEDLENVYKELLLLHNELKVVKKNEVTMEQAKEEGGWTISPTNDGRSKSDALSAMSEGMMMDIPDDAEDQELFEHGNPRQEEYDDNGIDYDDP